MRFKSTNYVTQLPLLFHLTNQKDDVNDFNRYQEFIDYYLLYLERQTIHFYSIKTNILGIISFYKPLIRKQY